MNNPLDVKENNEHALNFVFYLLAFFSVSVGLDTPYTTHAFFPERLSNHCQDLCPTYSEIFTKFDAVPLSDLSRKHMKHTTQNTKYTTPNKST
jgi:hypothetical protein